MVATCDSTTKKRRRRYSDCSWDLASGNRRTRRLSAQSGVTATSAAPSDGSLIGFPSKWYNCLWGSTNNELFSDGDIGVQVLDIGHHGRHTHHHQSWPLIKRSGQLKITQFFSTQVKQQWTYSKLKERYQDHQEPRISVVSVAHVEPSVVASQQPVDVAAQTSSPSHPISANPIRFPIDETNATKNDASSTSSTSLSSTCDVACLWENCDADLTSGGQSLLEHIQSAHVSCQASASLSAGNERYVCRWQGCKVQGRTSSSRAWLERHVLTHGGSKPFRCIVDTCHQRFNSQVALERHVNAHFNQEVGQNGNGNSSQGVKRECAPAKLVRRNSKKSKYRRSKAAPARLFDYFDSGVMERLRHQLFISQESQQRLGLSSHNNCLTVQSQVIGRRLDANGETRVLLQWVPKDLLPDQWVMEDEVVTRKSIPLYNLNKASQIRVHHLLNAMPTTTSTSRKQRRK